MKKINNISFVNVDFNDGFWRSKYDVNKNVSIHNVYKRFEETGRFDALRYNWEEGKPIPHRFYDSDAAKWIEAVSYLIMKDKDGYAEQQKIIDECVDCMAEHQLENGYLNSHFIQIEPDKIFTDRDGHELYTAGHLIEAAIAYHQATGKRKFLDVMIKNVECIEKTFVVDKSAQFTTGGHEEIELALIKLYDHTGDKKYLDLAMFFIDSRGVSEEQPIGRYGSHAYSQSHLPVREQTEALGHAVRAGYLYTGMINAALRTGDQALFDACERLFDNIVNTRMYITGGIGSSNKGECFTVSYDLPNLEAYSETCAGLALMFFAHGLQEKRLDSKYADIIEKVMYNNLLSSVSEDGKSFFYENPLELFVAAIGRETAIQQKHWTKMPLRQRVEIFSCSCCPPNLNRTIARLGDFFFTETDDTLVVQQYGALSLNNDKIDLTVNTKYPQENTVRFIGSNNKYKKLMFRLPAWCNQYSVSGAAISRIEGGYIVLDNAGESFDITLTLTMAPTFLRSNSKVRANCGRVALTYGPTVYCLERIDNPYELNAVSVDIDAEVKVVEVDGVTELLAQGYVDKDIDELYAPATSDKEPVTLRYRPYRTFANREECDMVIWVRSN